MKPKTIFFIETGAVVAAMSLTLAFNSLRAATEETRADVDKPAAVSGQNAPPTAPDVESVDEAPVAPALVPAPLKPTPGMEEIFKLARSGVSEEVIEAFVEKSGKVYKPTVEEIIYLKDLGVAPVAIAKLIRTGSGDSELAQQVEAGKFDSLEQQNTAVADDEANAADQAHYAAAPQPLANAPVANVSAEADTNVDLNYFKASLAAYGSWVYIDGYGECWRPTVAIANSDWRPYFDSGRWVYSNCGWYWLSDYSWGWAPFHYGRWYNHGRFGWVWVPSYTWGPAWVEWRTTSAYCGWAPLPPYFGSGFGVSYWRGSWGLSIGWSSFNWVPYRYCSGYYPRHYAAHYGVRHEIYRRSTVIQPTIIGDNNTVIVTGPNARVVADAGRTEIRRVNIRDIGGRDSRGARDYLENGGRTLAAFRPTVSPTRVRPETELANRRAEFRRPSVIEPAGGGSASSLVTEREAGSRRGVTLHGDSPDRQNAQSSSTWRSGITRRSGAIASESRTEGQNTTVNPRPEYRRPASEPTPILRNGRSLTYTRPVSVGEPAIGGGLRTESSRPTRFWSTPPDRSLESVTRQTVTTPNRSFRSPSVSDAPTITPSRQPSRDYDESRSSSSDNNFRSENSRSSRPAIRPSSVPSGVTIPASRSPNFSRPSIAPPSRSSQSFSRPSPAPSFSRPSAPEPSRQVSSPPPSSAPSRSASPQSNSDGGGGRGGRPSRR